MYTYKSFLGSARVLKHYPLFLKSLQFTYTGGQWQIREHQIASGKGENIRT